MTAGTAAFDTTVASKSTVDSAATGKPRMEAVDTARLIAAVGVVWIHACQSPETTYLTVLGRFAVPFFSAAAAYFLVNSLALRGCFGSVDFLCSRLRRLYLPFVVWSLVYLAFKAAKGVVMPDQPSDLPGWNILWTGGAYHLWFIPFLLVASCGLYGLVRFTRYVPHGLMGLAVCGYVLGLYQAFYLQSFEISDAVLGYALQTLPGLLWGCALAAMLVNSAIVPARDTLICGTAIGLFATCECLLFRTGRNILLENAAGVSLLMAGLYVGRMHWLRMPAALGQVSLGVYFSHLLFLKIGEAVAGRADLASGVSFTAAMIVVATAASAALSLLLARYRQTRWLVM